MALGEQVTDYEREEISLYKSSISENLKKNL